MKTDAQLLLCHQNNGCVECFSEMAYRDSLRNRPMKVASEGIPTGVQLELFPEYVPLPLAAEDPYAYEDIPARKYSG